jgi:hypothetical protein
MRISGPALYLAGISCFPPGCSTENERQGMIAANVRAIQEARKIQAEIAATRECPDDLVGWQRDRDPASAAPTLEIADYTLIFECESNLEFAITVKYSFDSGTFVTGRASGPLEISYGHFTDMHSIEITAADDAAAVASRVVRE